MDSQKITWRDHLEELRRQARKDEADALQRISMLDAQLATWGNKLNEPYDGNGS